MLDSKVVALLNQQINKEFYSAYLYLDFSNYYYDIGLDGFGNWYKIQAQEERDHALLFLQYLQNNDEKIVLEAIENDSSYDSKDQVQMKIGVHVLPRFPKDSTDRNRTSPFAFTGNKF